MTSRRGRKGAALVIAAGLTLAACGGSSDDAAPIETDPNTPTTDAPTDETTAVTEGTPETVAPSTTSGSDGVATTAPADGASPTSAPPQARPPTTAPAAPDDGCSTDGSPTAIEVAAAPAPEVPVAAESADSPFPDLVVRQLNCAPGWVQLRNEIPADIPVLAWFWAPH